MHVRLDIARSAYDYALMIPQSETERVLEEQLADLGTQVERRVELLSFQDNGDSVSAVLRHHDGREETVDASYLCGCDGAHSTVRHALGVQFEGSTMPSDWALGDLYIEGELSQDELTICWKRDGVLAIFPMGDQRFRVIADIGTSSPAAPPAPTLERMQELLDERGPPACAPTIPSGSAVSASTNARSRITGMAGYSCRAMPRTRHSPAGGQGMNTGCRTPSTWPGSSPRSGTAMPPKRCWTATPPSAAPSAIRCCATPAT